MQDAQVPTDPEDGASDQPRRAGIRLRDTEAVATARRDMFGDGSLVDALAGSPPAPANAEGAAEPAASAQPAVPPQPEVAEGQADPIRQAAPAVPAGSASAVASGFADVAQSLDAIIDSFPVAPPASLLPRSGEGPAEASLAAPSPEIAPAVGAEPDAAGASPETAPLAATPPMGISSLFDSLGDAGQSADNAPLVEEPPAPGAPTLALDMSMLEIRVRTRPALLPESHPPPATAPAGAPPPPVYPGPQAPESPAPEIQAPEIQAPETQAHGTQPDGVQADEAEAGGLDLDMSMLERPQARPVLQPESAPYESYGDRSPSLAGEPQAGELDTYGPRAMDAASYPAAGPDAPAQDGGEPPFADVAGSLPFSGRLAPPSFSEPDGAGAQPYDGPAALPDLAEPGQAVGPPPFLEPLVMPGRAEPSEPAIALGYGEPVAAPEFRGLSEPADARAVPEPLVMPAYAEPAEAEARPMFDAAHKIAAEAQATADALDNLKRVLAHTDPGQQEPIAPGQSRLRFNLHGDPAPFPSDGPAALIPMPAPLPEPPERGRFGRIYLLGFLTGLGLSLMAGIALYVLINVV